MEICEIKTVDASTQTGLVTSAEHHISALSQKYASRGLAKAALNDAAEQMRHEEETRKLSPDAYRLSLYTDAAINGCYRRGKDTMSSDDVVRYFGEIRAAHLHNTDLSGNTGVDECPACTETEESRAMTVAEETKGLTAVKKRVCALPASVSEKLKAAVPTWFDSSAPDASKEKRRYPVSAFAAIAAVAASLMLIVASSVLLTRAESNISRLQKQISTTSSEVAELRSDFEVQNDLLEIRRIAIEEYGMVEEDYLKMEYLSLSSSDEVEAYEEEREKNVSLDAILSAIGIK